MKFVSYFLFTISVANEQKVNHENYKLLSKLVDIQQGRYGKKIDNKNQTSVSSLKYSPSKRTVTNRSMVLNNSRSYLQDSIMKINQTSGATL